MAENAPPPWWPPALRALRVGTCYGLGLFALELLGAVAVMQFTGGAGSLLGVLAPRLLRLAVAYAAVGAVFGLLTAPLAARFRSRLPADAWRVETSALALAFTLVALLWNPEGLLPRRAYVALAWGGSLVALPVAWAARRWRPFRVGLAGAAAALVVVSLLPARLPPRAAGSRDRPNVVVIVVDTLRADHVGAYGYRRDTTPHIDRLAAEGVVFERASTTETWTLPGHASLFTGLYPREHQAHMAHPVLEPQHLTFAEVLRDAGYRTAGFSANPWLSPVAGLGQGFEVFAYVGTQTTTGAFFLPLAWSRISPGDLGAGGVTDAALDWLADVEAPFLLFLNYMEAHEPYGSVPEPFRSRYLDEPLPPDIGRRWVRHTARYQCLSCEPEEHPDLICDGDGWRARPEHLVEAVALYDAGVRYVDHQIGRIREALERRGVLDETLVIVTSDHGEALGEQGRIGHGSFLVESVTNVPLVMRHPPTFSAGARVSHATGLIDVFPTVEEIAGLGVSAHRHARSLVPTDAPWTRSETLAEHVPPPERVARSVARVAGCPSNSAGRASASLRLDEMKVVEVEGGAVVVYDLAADPREERDIAPALGDGVAPLVEKLHDALRALEEGAITGPAHDLDPRTRRALEALGYVP